MVGSGGEAGWWVSVGLVRTVLQISKTTEQRNVRCTLPLMFLSPPHMRS